MSFNNDSELNSSTIMIESDFDLFNNELKGGAIKVLTRNSENISDTSSVNLDHDSDFDIFDSDMNGGGIKVLTRNSENISDTSSVNLDHDSDFDISDSDMNGGGFGIEAILASSAALATIFTNYEKKQEEKNKDLKEIVILSTKILANMVKVIKAKKFYLDFDAEKEFLNKYHQNMGKILLNQALNDLTDRQELKNILNLNTIAIIEIKQLIKENDSTLLEKYNISRLVKLLLEKLPKL